MSDELDENMPDMVYSDTPRDLRPDLTFYGIEEVDRGVCEDTFENRSVLRVNKLNWQPIFDANGEITNNIEVLSIEMRTAKSISSAEDKKPVLTDDRDLNSDYLTEEALLIEEQSDILVPLWVIAATRTWLRVKETRKQNPKAYPLLGGPPTRCRYIKLDGVRCLMWCTGRTTDDGLCRVHLGGKNNNITGAVAQARRRAYQAAPTAISILENLMESAESEPVKLKAATEILDRAGVRGGIEIEAKVDLEVKPAEELIRERLMRLAPQAIQAAREEDLILEVDVVNVSEPEPEPEAAAEPLTEPKTKKPKKKDNG